MTQTLIEQLEALPRYAPNIGGDMIYSGQPPETLKWINADDLRAIIEQHKQNECQVSSSVMRDALLRSVEVIAPAAQLAIAAELVKALSDDSFAATFQSMAGYRTALIAKAKGVVG